MTKLSTFDKIFKTTSEEEEGKEFYLDLELHTLDKKKKGCITLMVRSPESEHYKRAQLELSSRLSSTPVKKGFRQKKARDQDITPEETINYMRQLVADSLWISSKDLLDGEGNEVGATPESRMLALEQSTKLYELIIYLGDTFLDREGDSD